jgi:CBS-domain-containing membrane protein
VHLIDEKFKDDPLPYVIQGALAGFMIFIILLVLDIVTETALIAALASSAFVGFTMPHSESSSPRRLMGGYAVSMVIGISCSIIAKHEILLEHIPEHPLLISMAAISVGFSIFIMVITDTEHAPAAGLALGLVLNPWDAATIVLIFFSISFIATSKRLLKGRMIDLI